MFVLFPLLYCLFRDFCYFHVGYSLPVFSIFSHSLESFWSFLNFCLKILLLFHFVCPLRVFFFLIMSIYSCSLYFSLHCRNFFFNLANLRLILCLMFSNSDSYSFMPYIILLMSCSLSFSIFTFIYLTVPGLSLGP